MQSAAVVINPVFTYSKGQLHLEEQKPVDLLAKGNHNLDWQFSILFKEKSDDRDLRPMVYPGRFVFPSPLRGPKNNLFFICELRKSHWTEEVKQPAPGECGRTCFVTVKNAPNEGEPKKAKVPKVVPPSLDTFVVSQLVSVWMMHFLIEKCA